MEVTINFYPVDAAGVVHLEEFTYQEVYSNADLYNRLRRVIGSNNFFLEDDAGRILPRDGNNLDWGEFTLKLAVPIPSAPGGEGGRKKKRRSRSKRSRRSRSKRSRRSRSKRLQK
jgi:hypothetical protein